MINLPSFSDANYRIAGYVATAFITISGVFLSYEIIADSGWEIRAQWNMFKSWLIWPLYIVGLLFALTNLGKTHYSQDTIIETEYSDGHRTREKSNDITDFMLGHIFIPILGHFVLEPLFIAALIYYPFMCIVALLGQLVPYILTILILAICFGAFKFTALVGKEVGSVILIAAALLLTVGFGYGGYAIRSANAPYEYHAPSDPEIMASDTVTVGNPDEEIEEKVETTTEKNDKSATTEKSSDSKAASNPQQATTDAEFEDAPATKKPLATDDEF